MRILDRSVYVGPSLYAHFPVIRLELDLGALEAWPTGRLGTPFVDALAAALPGLAEHGCSYREPGGFLSAHARGRGHLARARARARRHRTAEHRGRGSHLRQDARAGPPGVYTVVYEYAQRDEGIAAGELGLAAAVHRCCRRRSGRPTRCPTDWSWQEARDEFIRFAQRRALGPSTAALVRAAERHGIPWLRLNDQSLVQLGHGKYQQRIQATVTSRTSHIAVELASDKEETNKILATLGLPVPKQELVQSEGQAVRAARRIGFPVVTKPYNGNHGRGISIRLTTDEEVAQGFAVAREHSRSVIVETFLEGDDHRLLVVNGELVAATRRTPGPRRRRRRAHDRAADRDRESGSAPRRGPRKGADASGARRAGAENARARGACAPIRCRSRGKSSICARRRICPRAARRPTSPTSSIPITARWRSARCAPSAWTSVAWIFCRKTSRKATARSAAASAR